MFLELQGVVEIADEAYWQYRVFMLSGAIVLWHEPVNQPDRPVKDILMDARMVYLHDTNDAEGD